MSRNASTKCSFSRWIIATTLLLCCAGYSAAQTQLLGPKAEVRGTLGGSTFNDNEIPHGVIGGSVRIYVSRRFSLEPEVMYMHHSENDQDIVFQPNVAVDLMKPSGKFVPYVIAGVGVIHHRGRFSGFDFTTGAPRTFDTSFTSWTASAGGGVKIFVTDKLFIAPEARRPRTRVKRNVQYWLCVLEQGARLSGRSGTE